MKVLAGFLVALTLAGCSTYTEYGQSRTPSSAAFDPIQDKIIGTIAFTQPYEEGPFLAHIGQEAIYRFECSGGRKSTTLESAKIKMSSADLAGVTNLNFSNDPYFFPTITFPNYASCTKQLAILGSAQQNNPVMLNIPSLQSIQLSGTVERVIKINSQQLLSYTYRARGAELNILTDDAGKFYTIEYNHNGVELQSLPMNKSDMSRFEEKGESYFSAAFGHRKIIAVNAYESDALAQKACTDILSNLKSGNLKLNRIKINKDASFSFN